MSAPSFESIVDLLHYRVRESGDADAMYGYRDGAWYTMSWNDVGQRVRGVACGLLSLGIAHGDRVAILSVTRPEWIVVDYAILSAAGATSTIFSSNTPAECAFILSDSGAVFCFVEDAEQAAKLVEQKAELPHVRKVIWIDGEPPAGDDWMMSLADLEAAGAAWDAANPGRCEEVAGNVRSTDLATLIYTSGTTGRPKGVMLNHSNWVYEAGATHEIALLEPTDVQYLFLPLAHSFAKVLEVTFLRTATPTAVNGDIDGLLDYLGDIRPTVMAAVPRVYEKVYNKVVSGAKEAGGLKYKIFRWAVAVGSEVSKLRQNGKEPSGLLALKHKLADRLVFSKLKNRFGGRIRFFVSGGAPLSREIAEFFHAADLLVLEGYGLTETSAASFVNRPNRFKFGTVGPALPGTEVRIAEDGEIMIRGGGVMQGYYQMPEDTAETLIDGWLATGDIGEVDSGGFLRITDRKKDLIVTAGGKNVAPQYVENQLKVASNLISQVVMLGDRRPFCIALVTINEETVGKYAQDHGIAYSDYAELASQPQIHDRVWQDVAALNAKLASYEQIKKIKLLPADFSQETGELTPKMSIKRKVVEKKYAADIEELYASKARATL
jgi:long-chain acyl-CoA synthetase